MFEATEDARECEHRSCCYTLWLRYHVENYGANHARIGSKMDFVFDKHSPLPAHVQIQEQIKFALLLGQLRPGDTLPSIRDVEKQVGISRGIVRKAYLGLRSSGILNLRHGKGVVVDKDLRYGDHGNIGRKCAEFSREVLARLHQMGVAPTSFARYLQQRAREDDGKYPFIIFVDATQKIAEERAAKISAVWQMTVPGISIDGLKQMDPVRLKKIHKILTNYLRYDEVANAVKGDAPEVIPLGLAFESSTVREWSRLRRGAAVAYVMDDRDYPSLSLILELYRKILLEPSVHITAVPLSQIPDLKLFVSSNKHHKVIFSNRIWGGLPAELQRHPKVTYARMTVDLGSLENARIRAGVIV